MDTRTEYRVTVSFIVPAISEAEAERLLTAWITDAEVQTHYTVHYEANVVRVEQESYKN
jgi:DNA recombination-dependent growth factor C